MSDTTRSMMIDQPQLNMLEKLSVWFSWITAGVTFFTVGWWVMSPDDPLGAVSLLTCQSIVAMLGQALLLACLIAAMATVIAGRKRSDIGTMSAAIGLAIVSFKGDSMEYLLLQELENSHTSLRILAFQLTLESIAWLLVIMVTLAVSGWLMRISITQKFLDQPHSGYAQRWISLYDVPRLGSLLTADIKMNRTSLVDGLKHTALVSIIGFVAFVVLSAGLTGRSIQHGQVVFVVAASICIGCFFAYRYVTVYSALWSILAVGLLAVMGYVGSFVYGADMKELVSIPVSPFMRVLPIQFISVGTISAIAMFWSVQFHILYTESQRAISQSPTRKG